MSRIYTTIQGEMLDAICRKVYGDESGYVEQVMEANPGLAGLPHRLPIGTIINLPDLSRADDSQAVISLWS
ncbi:tail protein X [Brucella rhizosphaerae]|uniref:tail protein X n=1 Tax=Brucella rhizosphaerae TaxID=571254 RepID=UPI0004657A2E|nr:tail protein X [Brucella rhizosphaerae]